MKTIGLLGGMSWESSLEYYRAINEGIKSEKNKTKKNMNIIISWRINTPKFND